jgi:DNA-binding NarL/FixJ family response regulator
MGGAEAFRELRKINPDVRVLISSGFSQHGTVRKLREEGAIGFLNKPFRVAELAQQIAGAMAPQSP